MSPLCVWQFLYFVLLWQNNGLHIIQIPQTHMCLGTNKITQGRESAYSIDTTDLHPFVGRILLSHLLNRPVQIRLLSEGIAYRLFPESRRLTSMVFKLTFSWRWKGTGHHGPAACPSRGFKYSPVSAGCLLVTVSLSSINHGERSQSSHDTQDALKWQWGCVWVTLRRHDLSYS